MTGDLEGARAQASEAESVALGLDDPAVDAALAGTQGFLAQAGQDSRRRSSALLRVSAAGVRPR